MELYGLIGAKLTHSYSKKYFTAKFAAEGLNAAYELFPLEKIDDLPGLLKDHPQLMGLNVTIPYKQSVFRFLDKVSSTAMMIGAVNTIRIDNKSGKTVLTGYNTDAEGFQLTLDNMINGSRDRRVLILGNGGSAKAVKYVLRKKGIVYRSVSRKCLKADQLTYSMITPSIMDKYKIIINTTPVGMYPGIANAPDIPYELITPQHLLIDLIYNPEETLFLQRGREMGAATANGMTMFIQQAEAAWKIWKQKT